MTITTDNYESWFYRYSEGELDEREQREVEAFAVQHPALADELNLYDPELKLQAAPMVFADKESLMKHDHKVVPLWRWAVAACLAVVLMTGAGLFIFQREDNGPVVAQATLPQPLPAQQPTTVETTPTPFETNIPATSKRLPARKLARASAPQSSPTVSSHAEPTLVAATTNPASPTAETPQVEAQADNEPTVIVYHEIYVVADAEPQTVQQSPTNTDPENGIESLRSFGRSISTRLRAEALRAQGNAKMMLASL